MFESERRDLAWVPRWSIIRVNRRQSVAEHSYFVACYGLKIAEMIGWPACDHETWPTAGHLAVYLLRHDEAEALTGDLPGPIKRMCFEEGRLDSLLEDRFGSKARHTPLMASIKRAADLADECLYLAGEWASGNKAVASVRVNSANRLRSALAALPNNAGLRTELSRVIEREATGDKNLAGLTEELRIEVR